MLDHIVGHALKFFCDAMNERQLCSEDGCGNHRHGDSKYCYGHKKYHGTRRLLSLAIGLYCVFQYNNIFVFMMLMIWAGLSIMSEFSLKETLAPFAFLMVFNLVWPQLLMYWHRMSQ